MDDFVEINWLVDVPDYFQNYINTRFRLEGDHTITFLSTLIAAGKCLEIFCKNYSNNYIKDDYKFIRFFQEFKLFLDFLIINDDKINDKEKDFLRMVKYQGVVYHKIQEEDNLHGELYIPWRLDIDEGDRYFYINIKEPYYAIDLEGFNIVCGRLNINNFDFSGCEENYILFPFIEKCIIKSL